MSRGTMCHMAIYRDYAPFYDGSGQIRFAVLFGQYLNELLQKHPVPGRRVLDLACGTGTLALILADRGWEVVGVDASPEMLAIARERSASSDTPERHSFFQADMSRLASFTPFYSEFDLVTCSYDSLNYLLTDEELAACLAGIAHVLRPGGLFVGDMNTRYFLEHDWGNCEVIERPNFVQVSQSRFDPVTACSTMVLSGFVGDDESGYQRFDETHIERAYSPERVAELITQAGLDVEAAYECFTFSPVYEQAQRIAWVARKP